MRRNAGKAVKHIIMPKRKRGADLDAKKPVRELKEKSDVKPATQSSLYSCWLMKSEPESRFENGVDVKFGIEDLKACENQTACWDGVRNYQARNFMRDQMKLGHKVFFYHSNTKEPGIAAICKVVKESYVDHTQFDSKDPHYDRISWDHYTFGNMVDNPHDFWEVLTPKKLSASRSASKENPKWYMVDVKYERMMKRYISLAELKKMHLDYKQNGGPLKSCDICLKSASKENPKWYMVDVKYERMMKRYISLAELKKIHLDHKQNDGPLKSLALFTRARLSVQPVTEEEWKFIVSLEDQDKQ